MFFNSKCLSRKLRDSVFDNKLSLDAAVKDLAEKYKMDRSSKSVTMDHQVRIALLVGVY